MAAYSLRVYPSGKRDMRPRADGICALRSCNEPLTEKALKENDPWHSAECCRTHHEVTTHTEHGRAPASKETRAKQKASREKTTARNYEIRKGGRQPATVPGDA